MLTQRRARREFKFDPNDESGLIKELTLQVRKVIGPFAAPKKIYLVSDLPKTRSGKIMRQRANHVHKFHEKTPQHARRLANDVELSPADTKKVKRLLGR